MSRAERECVQSLKRWGVYAQNTLDMVICPKCGHITVPSRGRPDYICIKGDAGFVVEVKQARESFSFKDLRPEQREWAQWFYHTFGGRYYLWLSMGKSIRSKDFPRRTWLIPLRDYMAIESMIIEQGSIPYLADKHHSKEMQRLHLDAVHLFTPYELTWQGGTWSEPPYPI